MATTTLRGSVPAPERNPLPDESIDPRALDSCYGYARHRDVVKVNWPQHYARRSLRSRM